MAEQTAKNPEHKVLFLNLVLMLSSSAMQQLGKIMNPMTGATEISLEGAQATIDLLEMLKAKTAGNLDRDETRLITDTLATLQMNYVETAQAEAANPKAEKPDEKQAGTSASEPTPAAKPNAVKKPGDADDARFHKSYG